MRRCVRIRRYKSIVDVTRELATVNVFCGKTCTGKTNILEALALLGAAASGSLLPAAPRWRSPAGRRPSPRRDTLGAVQSRSGAHGPLRCGAHRTIGSYDGKQVNRKPPA